MKRHLFALCGAVAATFACVNTETPQQQLLVVDPVLDSVFVGDTLAPRSVYLRDGSGGHHDPGPVSWSINPSTVATVDAAGRVAGKAKGSAVVFATAAGVTSGAIVVVSRPLELTLLLDTLFLMPDDTITVPFAIAQKTPAATTVRFDSSKVSNVYTMDTITGKITAHEAGEGRYVARVSDGTNSVSDTGGVVILSLTDTSTNGRFYMTAFGTAIRHQSGIAEAAHYQKLNQKLAFRLIDTLTANGSTEAILITLRDSLLAAGTFEIDSISPQEVTTQVNQQNPYCNPQRPWAYWSSNPTTAGVPGIVALSHGTASSAVAGYLSITQYTPALVGGGSILSGRYLFQAQRLDLYADPLGLETIRGIFVVPLRMRSVCQN